MSCNGCRVLRKGCSESCVLRPCIQWIQSPEAQGHATVFVAKFFGRAGLMAFISNVPDLQRAGLFESLLFEACGRTINPVSGAVGLLAAGNWHLCKAAVETVLRGGAPRALPGTAAGAADDRDRGLYESRTVGDVWTTSKRRKGVPAGGDVEAECDLDLCLSAGGGEVRRRRRPATPSMNSEESVTTSAESSGGGGEPRLLNLLV